MIVLPAGLVEFHLRAKLIEPLPKVFILQFDWDPSHATQAWDCKSIILTQFLKLKLNKFSIHLLKLLSPRRLMTIFKNFFHSTKCSLPDNCLCWGRKAWSFKDLLRGLWLKNILSPRWHSADWDSVWPETDWSDSTWEPRVRWRADGDRPVQRHVQIKEMIIFTKNLFW